MSFRALGLGDVFIVGFLGLRPCGGLGLDGCSVGSWISGAKALASGFRV